LKNKKCELELDRVGEKSRVSGRKEKFFG